MTIRAGLVVAAAILGQTGLSWGQQPLSTAFTVQGHLDVAGSAGNGPHDFRCRLFDDPTSGAQMGGDVYLDDVGVQGGIFTLEANFGDVFTSEALWLEIAVRDGASTGNYTTLSPRMELTPAPFAHHAVEADFAADALTLDGNPASSFALTNHDHDSVYAALVHTHNYAPINHDHPNASGNAPYGDGSAGSFTVAANTDWSASPPANLNFQFTDLTVNPGVTLTLPSGLTIRATGAFHNAGTIVVRPYAAGGTIGLRNTGINSKQSTYRTPGTGVAMGPAGFGERVYGTNEPTFGGAGGAGVGGAVSASGVLSPGPAGGGGGAGCLAGTLGTTTTAGGSGGGTLVVVAGGAVTNAGTINADGGTPSGSVAGGGGGGGGVIVLASRTSVTNSGTINARGGAGGSSGVSNGAGGGGGGGIVQLVAPAAINSGAIVVSGGLPGPIGASGSVTGSASRLGGGGGGASGGDGGGGGGIAPGNSPEAGTTGGPGLVLVRTSVDPTALL
jgi:hypothetical protein